MYLRGSSINLRRRRRKPSSPWRIAFLIALILGVLYLNQVVVPATPYFLSATPTPTRSPESLTAEAEELYRAGKLPQAIQVYQQAIIANPGNPRYYLEMARLQIYTNEYEQARISAENALLLSPNLSMGYALKGRALAYQELYSEAIAAIKTAIDLDPNNAEAYAFLAETLIDQGDYEDIQTAIDNSQKARDLAPTLLETHRARAYVLYATGNYADAIQEYKAALSINDKLWELHYGLGIVYRLTEEYDLATQSMLAAIAFNPENPNIPTDLSRTYATQGQFGKAVQYAEQALKIAPSNPRLHGNLGFMYYKNGDYEKALKELTLAVRGGTTESGISVEGLPLEPGRIADEYYSFYGLSLARLKRCDEAVTVFQLILQTMGADQIAYYNANEGIAFCQETLGTSTP